MIPVWDFRTVVTEIRVEKGKEGKASIVGLAIPYGVWSEDLGGFRERFVAGSVSESMQTDDWRALYNHSSLHVMGRMSAKTLEAWEEQDGVHYRVSPPMEADWARGAMASIGRGDVRENSFAFRAQPEHSLWEEKDNLLWRTVLKASVRELGPQTFPAYPQTTAEARGGDEFRTIDAILDEARQFLNGLRKVALDPRTMQLLDQADEEAPTWA